MCEVRQNVKCVKSPGKMRAERGRRQTKTARASRCDCRVKTRSFCTPQRHRNARVEEASSYGIPAVILSENKTAFHYGKRRIHRNARVCLHYVQDRECRRRFVLRRNGMRTQCKCRIYIGRQENKHLRCVPQPRFSTVPTKRKRSHDNDAYLENAATVYAKR